MCAYYPSERLLPCYSKGELTAKKIEFSSIKNDVLCAEAEVSELSRYSSVSVQNMLDRLLDGGYISADEYVKRLPLGAVIDRDGLLELLEQKKATKTEESEEI